MVFRLILASVLMHVAFSSLRLEVKVPRLRQVLLVSGLVSMAWDLQHFMQPSTFGLLTAALGAPSIFWTMTAILGSAAAMTQRRQSER